MYTKAKNNSDEAYRIPENYRGNAFRGEALSPQPPINITEEAISDDSAPQDPPFSEQTILPVSVAAPKAASSDIENGKRLSPLAAFLPPRLSAEKSGILGDLGVEELLIIGILLLLSLSEADSDILLLLILLLFYK